MAKSRTKKPVATVKLCYYDSDERGALDLPSGWRPEITIAGHSFLPDSRPRNRYPLLPRTKAMRVAKKIATALGVEVQVEKT